MFVHCYTVEFLTTQIYMSLLVRDSGVGVGVVFFFQAEDGIRDLVRSRGLGDVYKRQANDFRVEHAAIGQLYRQAVGIACDMVVRKDITVPVSYTHLTLPTSDLV